jgi:hypothetical protein
VRTGSIGTIWTIPSVSTSNTAIPLSIAKSATIDVKQERKPLRGQNMDPIDMLAGAREITLKLANNDFRASTFQLAFQGSTLTPNATKLASIAEPFTVPTTPFQVTVSNSATWSEDGGVLDLTAGKWLTRVASAPATGQFSAAAGVYTFAGADVAHNTVITYSYTSTLAGSQTLTQNQQVVQASTGYLVRIYNNWVINGTTRPLGLEFPSVHFSDLSFALKNDDWTEQSLTGIAMQDPASQLIVKMYLGE